MKIQKTIVLFAVALIAVITLAGSAQAFTEALYGQVNHTEAEGQMATFWLDIDPSDYSTEPILQGDPVDYYFWSDVEPHLIRNGIGAGVYYNYTVAIFCTGTKRSTLGVEGDPYTNFIRNVTYLHGYGLNDGATEILPPYGTYWDVTLCEETFSKELGLGWNLISMPLTNAADMTVENIINTSLGGSYDALCKYNAISNNYETLSSTDVMENGVGYFIHMTQADTWTYSGPGYTTINEPLEAGLNMVGWMNCDKKISGNLTSVADNYYYMASWNATAQEFETYNPAAPDPDNPTGFNDFFDMERGTGYFLSMKVSDTLDESC